MSVKKLKPEDLEPVLAEIYSVNCLGESKWYEVVYHDGNMWRSYAGSDTFDDGEKVLRWRYADEAINQASR